jgi:hypothetical protein
MGGNFQHYPEIDLAKNDMTIHYSTLAQAELPGYQEGCKGSLRWKGRAKCSKKSVPKRIGLDAC